MITSVGIPAFNEEENIGQLLNALMVQNENAVRIKEIIVVSSGSTDRTDAIVKEASDLDSRIELVREQERNGKASAINAFLEQVGSVDSLVIESADTIPESNTIEELHRPFVEADVGITGARPVPTNSPHHFLGYASNILWELHHIISMENPGTPKLGELIAFRRSLIHRLPVETSADEAWIQAAVNALGFRAVYVPEAIVWNRGPSCIRDFISQRKRVYNAHLVLRPRVEYEPMTMRLDQILRSIPRLQNRKRPGWLIGTACLEAIARIAASWDFHVHRANPYIWSRIASTKEV